MTLKKLTIIFCLSILPLVAYSNISTERASTSIFDELDFKSKSQKCRDEFSDRQKQRVCSINVEMGVFQLLPHIKAAQAESYSKNKINQCLGKLDLYSRLLDYNLMVTCLRKIHGQSFKNKSIKDISRLEQQNISSEKLLKLGKVLMYGINVDRDLLKASKLMVQAYLKGNDGAIKSLNFLMAYVDSNLSHLPQNVTKDIYKTVIVDTERKARNGDADLAYFLAQYAYEKGDYKTENMWYEIAIRKDHIGALNNFAVNYAKGKGVKKNEAKAIELYTKAAVLGSKYAQQTLGHRYVHGRGVEKNIRQGIDYYKQSALQGHAKAAFELAELYRKGEVVSKDYQLALENYRIAAKSKKAFYDKAPKAKSWIGYFYEKGYAVEIDNNQAFKWYTSAGNEGDSFAQSQLGYFYQKGIAVEKNLSKAFEWYLKAAKRNRSYAQRKIGYLYQFGYGTNKDLIKSHEWYLKAGENGDSYAQHQLGGIYRDGRGINSDIQKAHYWFNKAAHQNKKESMYALANLLWNGRGVEVNKKQASFWYHKSAEKNYAIAQFWLGQMYATGQFVKKDVKKACEWSLKASKNGYDAAKQNYDKYCQ